MAGATVLRHTGRKGLVFVAPNESSPPTITVGGKTYTAHRPSPGEGTYQGHSGYQFIFPPEVTEAYGQDAQLSYGGQVQSVNINPAQEYRTDGGGIGDLRPAPNKDGGGLSGVGGQFQPGMAGQYGVIPANLEHLFPEAVLAKFKEIKAADYKFTDPMKYAEAFGSFNRGEIQKNFDMSKDLALNTLQTELEALTNFVPAASALKRQETALDNQFNQAQRTQQVNQALPNAAGDLAGQRERALSYASGNLPDSQQNAAYELGIRSAAADRSAAGGFGASSSVARKSSDLLSADQRLRLSQQGDQLLSSNLNQTAELFLAPTEYSNAGGQINVNPSLSPSQLINSSLNTINGLTTINPTTGLATEVGQNEFTTNLNQQTNQYNASNKFQESMYNSQTKNQFALDKFGYQVGYANAVAGGTQTNANTEFGLQQQDMFGQLMNQYQGSAQNAGSLQSGGILGGMLAAVGGLAGAGKGGGSSKGSSSDPSLTQDFGTYAGPDMGSNGKNVIESGLGAVKSLF